DRVHWLRADLLQGCKILRVEALQLLLPGGVRNFNSQHAIRVTDGACLFRYLRSSEERPGQQRRIVARVSPQGVGKNLLQGRAGMSHGVEASIVEQPGRSSLFAFRISLFALRFSPESLSSRPSPPRRARGGTCFLSARLRKFPPHKILRLFPVL